MRTYARTLILSTALGAVALLAACRGNDPDELVTSARGYLAKGDSKAAVIQLKNALQQKPNLPEARYLLGKVLLDAGDTNAAEFELRKALELKQPAPQVVPALARALLVGQQPQKLIDQFGDVNLDEPAAQADLKTSVANAYALVGNPEKADAAIAAALHAVPGYPETLLLQSRLAADQGKIDEALSLIDKAVASAPAEPQAWVDKGEILLFGKADKAGAEQAYRKALSVRAGYLPARYSLTALLLSNGDVKGASEQVAELRKAQAARSQITYFEAQLALLDHDPKKARELTQQLLKIAPDSVMVLQLAGTLELNNGSLLEAERFLNKAMLIAPDMSTVRQRLAQTFLRLQQPAKALAVLEPLLSKGNPDAMTYAMAGEAYLQSGDLVQAEANFANAAKIDPADTRSRTALALTRPRPTGEIGGVAQELQGIASNDKGTYADLALVSVYMRSKDYDRALKAIDAVEHKDPGKPMVFNLRGWVQLLRGDPAGARTSFERALALDPAYIPAATNLAVLDLSDKKPDAAKKRFEAVLAVDSANLDALTAIAGIRAREGGSTEEVGGLLAEAAKRNPSEPGPRVLLIEHYLNHKNVERALSAAQDAQVALPNSPAILDALGRAQLAAGDTNQAISSFNKLAGLDPSSPLAYLRLAEVYQAGKNVSGLEQSLKRALAIKPDLLEAQQGLMASALSDGRPKDALAVAHTVQEQRPNEPIGFMLEGAVDVSTKDYAGAAKIYRSTFKKFPTPDVAIKLHSVLLASGQEAEASQLATSWLAQHAKDTAFLAHLGEVAMARRDYVAAEAQFRRVIAIVPDNAPALNNLAWTLVKLNKPGAVEFAARADKLLPNSPALMDTLAMALASENHVDQALEVQKKVVALVPASPLFRLNLAKLQIRSGDKAAARGELETIAKLGNRFSDQEEVEQLLKSL